LNTRGRDRDHASIDAIDGGENTAPAFAPCNAPSTMMMMRGLNQDMRQPALTRKVKEAQRQPK
jgi:hypothetical protein